MIATLRKACKDWISVVESKWLGEGTRKGAALASTTFKVSLQDHEALVGQKM
jgi:hypothetical protein